MPGNIKCIFNLRTLNYELKYFFLDNNKVLIDLKSSVDYNISDFTKWKLSFKKTDKNYNFLMNSLTLCYYLISHITHYSYLIESLTLMV